MLLAQAIVDSLWNAWGRGVVFTVDREVSIVDREHTNSVACQSAGQTVTQGFQVLGSTVDHETSHSRP